MLSRYKKDEESREFSSSDTVSVFALLAGVTIIVWSIVTHAMSDQRLTKARVEAERLALQMLSSQLSEEPDSLARGPSSGTRSIVSTGQIGTDPWGHPFNFRLMAGTDNRQVIVVYSAGPDGKTETADQDFTIDRDGRLISVRFAGDDIGTIQRSWR